MRVRVEVRLLADEPAEQRGVDAVARCRGIDLGRERRRGAGRGGRAGRGRRRGRARGGLQRRGEGGGRRGRATGVACAPTGASEAIMAWICSIRSKATAALTSPPGGGGSRGPSRRAWRRSRWASAAWCSARWRCLRRSRTSRRCWAAARAWRRDSTSASRRVTSSSALRRSVSTRSSQSCWATIVCPSSGAPARRASRAWRTRSDAGPERGSVALTARQARRELLAGTVLVVFAKLAHTLEPEAERVSSTFRVVGRCGRDERRLDARPTWHPRAACGIAARSSSSPRSSSS